MPTQVLIIEGDPTTAPFESNLLDKLTKELRVGNYAEVEVPRRKSRGVQRKMWLYNKANPDLPWRFRTSAIRIPGTQLTTVRIWKEEKS